MAKAKQPEKKLTVSLPEPLHKALKVAAARRGVDMRELVIKGLQAIKVTEEGQR